MIIVIQLKKNVAGAYILGIVIDKLGYKQKPSPIVLLKIDKNLEIRFYYTILMFYLPICLKIKSGGELPFNAKKVAKQ